MTRTYTQAELDAAVAAARAEGMREAAGIAGQWPKDGPKAHSLRDIILARAAEIDPTA